MSDPRAATATDCATLDALLGPSRGPSPEMAPALWRVRACPERAGQALAAALGALRASDDTAALERATWLGHYVHDGRLYDTASAVAADPAAAPWARVAALRVLVWAKAPSQLAGLGGMLRAPACAAGCYSTYSGHYYGGGMVAGRERHPWPVFGRALPAGYAARVDALCARLAADAATPEVVRAAARHASAVPAESGDLGGR